MASRHRFNTVDLFCGAGGLSLGFEMDGHRVMAGVDFAAPEVDTFRGLFPGAAGIHADITELSGAELRRALPEPVDVLLGGPSCQGFSTSGGLSSGGRNRYDPRNSLFRDYVRLAAELKPEFLVMENVVGLLLYGKGAVAKEIIRMLAEIGYSAAPLILLAADYGVPQLRRRLVFVAQRGNVDKVRFPRVSHSAEGLWSGFALPFEHLSRIGHGRTELGLEPHVTIGEALSDLPRIKSGNKESSPSYRSDPQTSYQHYLRAGDPDLTQHMASQLSEGHLEIIRSLKPGQNWTDVPQHLLPERFKKLRSYDATTLMKRMTWSEPAHTITTKFNEISTGSFIHPRQNRTLSVREAARLQSFPDSVKFEGSVTQVRRQIGNAVPPLLGKAIAGALSQNDEAGEVVLAATGPQAIGLKGQPRRKQAGQQVLALP